MESLKQPHHNTIALTNLVAIWSEVIARRASVWVGIRDTMTVMERRRLAVAPAPDPATRIPDPDPEPVAGFSEPRSAYERMRRHADSRSRVRFTPGDF